jgi:hypothetical protein
MPAAARGRAAGKSAKTWREALQRALNKPVDPKKANSPKRLEGVADACVDAALAGDMQAIGEIGNRIDGRPKMAPEDAETLDNFGVVLAGAWARMKGGDHAA